MASKLRTLAVTATTANLILSAVIPTLKEQTEIAEKSVVGQLLDYAEKKASLSVGELRRQFQADGSLENIEPYLQNAWQFVTTAGKVEEEELAT
jgi:hypothetical protein